MDKTKQYLPKLRIVIFNIERYTACEGKYRTSPLSQ